MTAPQGGILKHAINYISIPILGLFSEVVYFKVIYIGVKCYKDSSSCPSSNCINHMYIWCKCSKIFYCLYIHRRGARAILPGAVLHLPIFLLSCMSII